MKLFFRILLIVVDLKLKLFKIFYINLILRAFNIFNSQLFLNVSIFKRLLILKNFHSY